ncbi:hypothetical protein [Streptomyces drozdowiczii]|uniref:Uncharacterized protein n=1 Tax=Streptomyces drozdowiczii TaxID=202862 RepID=A0ABY6PPD8_9ACTN|nr:hypothetical protein [Streptomyces drozdowiczii]MCX0246435.1 hypothetical protein [Streptomyces drozdowiczii]UZK54063.1 hypothetical protein NEH16_07780 [Streptomyces drozdowiczii]
MPDQPTTATALTRAIHALKSPPPEGSQHYQSGWDTGLEAAIEVVRGFYDQPTAPPAADLRDRIVRALDECRTLVPAAQADAVLAVLPTSGPCSCGGHFPLHHLHADTHEPASAPVAPADRPADRRARYAAAIRDNDGWVLDGGQHMVDAVMAVADAEQAALRADLARAKDDRAYWYHELKSAEAKVERLRADRATTLREAADRVDNEELPQDYVDMFDNGARWAARLLRRLADEAQPPAPCGRSDSIPTPCSAGDHCCQDAVAAQQPETEASVTLATPCAGCRHTRNWHDMGTGRCLVPTGLAEQCGCETFTAPAPTEEPTR